MTAPMNKEKYERAEQQQVYRRALVRWSPNGR